jgi:hypothetical protein
MLEANPTRYDDSELTALEPKYGMGCRPKPVMRRFKGIRGNRNASRYGKENVE